MRITGLGQAPYYRVDGLSASADARDNRTNAPVKGKLPKQSADEKNAWQEDEEASIVVYA